MKEEVIEHLLERLENLEIKKGYSGHDLKVFDNAYVVDGVNDKDQDWFIFPDVNLEDIGNINQKVFAPEMRSFVGLKTISPKILRGTGARFSAKPMELTGARYDGNNCRIVKTFVEHSAGEYRSLFLNEDASLREEINNKCFAVAGVAFRHRYVWTVSFRINDGVALSFETDPTGAKETFKLRDVSPGKTRRDALRNWVSEHFRKNRNSLEDKTFISKHLRGATEFTWNGLSAEIKPSTFDVESVKKAQA